MTSGWAEQTEGMASPEPARLRAINALSSFMTSSPYRLAGKNGGAARAAGIAEFGDPEDRAAHARQLNIDHLLVLGVVQGSRSARLLPRHKTAVATAAAATVQAVYSQ